MYKFEFESKKFSICSVYTTKIKQVVRIVVNVDALVAFAKTLTAAKMKNIPDLIYKVLTSKTYAELNASLAPKTDFVTSWAFTHVHSIWQKDTLVAME